MATINSISQAEKWHKGYLLSNRKEAKTSGVNSLTLHWEEAKVRKHPSGVTLVFVPVDEFKNSNKKVGFHRLFIYRQNFDKVFDGKIIEFYGDQNYLNQNIERLALAYNDTKIAGFSGVVMAYNLKYQRLSGRVFKDGIATSAVAAIELKKGSNKTSNKRIASTILDYEGESCYDRYLVTYYTLGALVAVDPMLAILPFLVVQLTGRNSSMYIPTIVGLSLPGMRN